MAFDWLIRSHVVGRSPLIGYRASLNEVHEEKGMSELTKILYDGSIDTS